MDLGSEARRRSAIEGQKGIVDCPDWSEGQRDFFRAGQIVRNRTLFCGYLRIENAF
jgi:hypothetical protein